MRKEKNIAIVLFGALMIYLALRAIFVPMIHDEIATFFRYVHIHEIFPWHSEWSANNHYLNSLLTLGFYELFGSSPFALRLANLIFFPVFVFFVWKISGEIKNIYLRWGFLISLLFAHNFIEFFAISRGYGMSMALVMGAVWFAIRSIKENKAQHLVYSLLFLVFATYANLTIINSFILILVFLLLHVILSGKRKGLAGKLSIFLFLGILPLVIFIKILLELQVRGELYYGSLEGFISVSVKTLAKLMSSSGSMIFVIFAVLFFGLSLVIYIFRSYLNIRSCHFINLLNPQWIFVILLTGNIIASLLEHTIFSTNYPEDRTGLYFFPWLIGSVFFALDTFQFKKSWQAMIPVIPFIFLPLHFFSHLNLSWSSLENQAIPERFHDYVAKQNNPNEYPATVQGYQYRVFRWAYMNFREKDMLSKIHSSDYPSLDGDFQIVDISAYPEWKNYYDSIDSGKHSGLSLLERKNKLPRVPVKDSIHIKTKEIINDEYFNLMTGRVDTLAGSSLYFGFNLELISPKKPFHGWFVVTVYNKKNEAIRYEYFPFDWYRTDFSKPGRPFINGLLIHSLPSDADAFVCYIWNINKNSFEVRNGKVDIFRLEKEYENVHKK